MPLLDVYTKALTAQQVAHLLRRTTFGGTPAQLKDLTGKTADFIVQKLLVVQPAPNHPTDLDGTNFHEKPWGVPGTTDMERVQADGVRRNILKRWWLGSMVNQPLSISEKMTLFWQNHFVSTATAVSDARFLYRQNQLLRKLALGNFKTFVIEITKDPAMLFYLNGNQNIVGKPNENYGRELQELFTIGAGNYNEEDVKAAARVLTGWRGLNYRDNTTATIGTEFRANQHDTTDKVFSKFYGNKIIKGRTGATAGDDELKDLVDMILAQKETARFIVRKFYRWFFQAEISALVEKEFIEPLATIFQKDYEIKPVLLAMFKSQHFYEDTMLGSQIKSPLDLIIGAFRNFNYQIPDIKTDRTTFDLATQYIFQRSREQQMEVLDQVSVFGWRPYYDTDFYEIWISSTTLALRGVFTDALVKGSTTLKLSINVVDLAKATSTPDDPVKLVDEITENLFAFPLTKLQKDYLIDKVLIADLPRYEWGLEWNAYTSDPTNKNKLNAVKTKLETFFTFALRLAEFQMG
jgi:uncharacterized protein (DUF1800 family)